MYKRQDEQRVLVDGEFTEHIYKDLYTFTDNEGNSMTVEVDDDIWYQLSMDTPVQMCIRDRNQKKRRL